VVRSGEKFSEMYFVTSGAVKMENKFEVAEFSILPQYSFFGDYQILFDLSSIISYKTVSQVAPIVFMCLNKRVFLNLCELYPNTGKNIRLQSLERRYKQILKLIEFEEKMGLETIP